MSHERLKHIKENIMSAIEGQVCNIQEADCEELGEAIDMLKDLEEALYFCTITEAMEKTEKQPANGGGQNGHQQYMYYSEPYYYNGYSNPGTGGYMMYNQGNSSRGGNNSSSSYYQEPMMYAQGGGSSNSSGGNSSSSGGNSGSSSSYYQEPMMARDYREGRSPMSRKMYLEAKEHRGDSKTSQLKELERYMQELTSDMVDMIQEATPEEKQYLEKKISALASKIGQMK